MATDLRLPQLGDVMTEGRLVAWLAADGAEVRAGQPLYELETDKVSFTVEAPVGGVLRVVVAAGETVEVGTVVGRLADTAPSPREGAGRGGGTGVRATPAARRLARELAVDLRALGGGHRIREADVLAHHAALAPASVAAPVAPVAEVLPYRGRRRTIGERMLASQRAAAALTLTSEVRADAALDLVERLRADGVPLTLTRLVVRACAVALGDHPVLNARLVDDRIELARTLDIGVALDQEAGLIVPVLRDAGTRSLAETAIGVRDLTRRAAAGALTPDDLGGATFTVTSLASTVVDAFTPIIDPPQVAILGVGRVREVAAFQGADVVRRRVTTLSLTFDHRVTDGAPAARFLGRVAELLQGPEALG